MSSGSPKAALLTSTDTRVATWPGLLTTTAYCWAEASRPAPMEALSRSAEKNSQPT